MENETCPICKRELGKQNISKHHLIPKSRGGKHTDTITLHNICHQKIHSVFTEKELKNHFHTLERLTSHDTIKKFVKWVAKKDPAFYDGNSESKRKKNKKGQKLRK